MNDTKIPLSTTFLRAMREARTVVFHQNDMVERVEVVCHFANNDSTVSFDVNNGGRWCHGLAAPLQGLRVVSKLEAFDEGLKETVLTALRPTDSLYVYNRIGASNPHHLNKAGLVLHEAFLVAKRQSRHTGKSRNLRFLISAAVFDPQWGREYGYVAA